MMALKPALAALSAPCVITNPISLFSYIRLTSKSENPIL